MKNMTQQLPNAITLTALCFGLTAIYAALEGAWERAVILLIISTILDGLDGRVARMLGATSKIGEQLDSLCDTVNFGVAPALLLYLWALNVFGAAGWAIVLVYVMCTVVRLARFNMLCELPGRSPAYFSGLPSPIAALVIICPLTISFAFPEHFFFYPEISAAITLIASGLMVSTLPMFSFKTLKDTPFSQPTIKIAAAMLVLIAVVLAAIGKPWMILAECVFVYFSLLPLSMMHYKKI